jgi:putative oxidoreductase
MDEVDLGLGLVRWTIGSIVVGHGVGNLFGWLGGYGLDGTGAIFERLGFRPGRRWAAVAGLTEVGAGALLAAGLGTPLAVAGIVGVMANTIATAHRGKGPWYFNGGWEYNVVLLATATALGFTGPGRASLDQVLGWRGGGLGWGIAALAGGLAVGAAVLRFGRRGTRGDGTVVGSGAGMGAAGVTKAVA